MGQMWYNMLNNLLKHLHPMLDSLELRFALAHYTANPMLGRATPTDERKQNIGGQHLMSENMISW